MGRRLLTEETSCGVISELISLLKQGRGAGAAMAQPIYPMNDPAEMVGGIAALLVWDEIFENTFNSEVSGIDCILEVGADAFTYTVEDGVVRIVGEGDLHDRDYNHLRRTVVLTDSQLYSSDSPVYTLSIYPTPVFYAVYSTSNPITATVVVIVATLITSLAFLLYDVFVRREFRTKTALLQSKRAYMRYISHETRTPLSAVFMGLFVVENELASCLGFDSAESLEKELSSPKSVPKSSHPEGVNGKLSSEETRLKNTHDDKVLECFHLTKEIQQQAQGMFRVSPY